MATQGHKFFFPIMYPYKDLGVNYKDNGSEKSMTKIRLELASGIVMLDHC